MEIKYFLMIITCLSVISCNKLLPPAPEDNEIVEGTIPGLTPAQLNNFLAGDELFNKTYSKEEGLGPLFIQNSCAGCHIGDGKGHPSDLVIRFGKQTPDGFDNLLKSGGPQLQYRSIPGYPAEILPVDYDYKTERLPPIVVGNGYLAAVHDSTLLKNSDTDDSDNDGISGRPNYVAPQSYFNPLPVHISKDGKYIGRFGKKAIAITILDQIVFALKEDIGLTSDYDMTDIFNPAVGENSGDEVTDPEVSASDVQNLVFYQRTLKAPSRRNITVPDVLEGEKIFSSIGCVKCHRPDLITAKSDIAVLSEQVFHPYTDLLLHDMGPELDDGYPEGSATGSEWRTAPLWGLGLAMTTQGGTLYLLHDGRANSIKDALTFHGGEAENIRQKFFELTETEQQKIIRFLESL